MGVAGAAALREQAGLLRYGAAGGLGVGSGERDALLAAGRLHGEGEVESRGQLGARMGAQPACVETPLAGEGQSPPQNRLAAGEIDSLLAAEPRRDPDHERPSRIVALTAGSDGAGDEREREPAAEDDAQIHTLKAATCAPPVE